MGIGFIFMLWGILNCIGSRRPARLLTEIAKALMRLKTYLWWWIKKWGFFLVFLILHFKVLAFLIFMKGMELLLEQIELACDIS